MTVLYFDCSSGAAGDMILGALLDAGLPFDNLRDALGSLAVKADDIWTERVTRAGVSATKFHVRGEGAPVDHSHAHGHPHDHDRDRAHSHARTPSGTLTTQAPDITAHSRGVHRTLAEIVGLIEGSALSAAAKERAQALFHRLAEAEAAIHGTSVEAVHLHEVGALDSIIDIVGTVYGLEALGVDRVVASPLNVGGGTVRSAHGLLPVPAPATVRLLAGAPI